MTRVRSFIIQNNTKISYYSLCRLSPQSSTLDPRRVSLNTPNSYNYAERVHNTKNIISLTLKITNHPNKELNH